jgi:hypothetical protein
MNWIHVAQDRVQCSEHGNEPSIFIKYREFPCQLCDYQLLKVS